MEQLDENLGAAETLEKLTEEDLDQIEQILDNVPEV